MLSRFLGFWLLERGGRLRCLRAFRRKTFLCDEKTGTDGSRVF